MPTKEIIHRVIKVEILRNSHPFQLLLLALNPYTPCLVPPPPSLLWYLNHPRLAMVRDYRGTCCSIHIITRPWWQNKIADSFLLWFPLPIFSLNSIILCAAPKTDLQTRPSERASVYFHRNRLFVNSPADNSNISVRLCGVWFTCSREQLNWGCFCRYEETVTWH